MRGALSGFVKGCSQDFRLPRERFLSRAAKALGLLLVTDCTSRSIISSDVSLGKLEAAVSSGDAVEGPTAVCETGELLWTIPKGDSGGKPGEGGFRTHSPSSSCEPYLCCVGCVWCLPAWW